MIDIRPRLWETPRIGAELFDADPSSTPDGSERLAAAITIDTGPSGFIVSNDSSTEVSVLVTLLAKAPGSDADEARARLSALTRRPAPGQGAEALLWRRGMPTRRRSSGEWVATREGSIVIPLVPRHEFVIPQGWPADGEVVVAAVAAVAAGVGDEVALMAVDRGAHASLGERPVVPPQ